MKKNLYYQYAHSRENILKNVTLSFFRAIGSYPRLLLEVFIRKNFGERYFNLMSAFTVAFLLLIIPLFSLIPNVPKYGLQVDTDSFFLHYTTWYTFTGLFIWCSIQRGREITRNPSVYDFAKYSLYEGDINKKFYDLKLGAHKPDTRLVETLLEPLPFFIAGILLWLLHQKLGILLTVCSVICSLGQIATYTSVDNFVMDQIDGMIANQEFGKVFIDGLEASETRGFRVKAKRPDDLNLRKKIVECFIEDDENTEVN